VVAVKPSPWLLLGRGLTPFVCNNPVSAFVLFRAMCDLEPGRVWTLFNEKGVQVIKWGYADVVRG
jgi:hypothetical protein